MKKWLLIVILNVIYSPIYGFRVKENWFSSTKSYGYFNKKEYTEEELPPPLFNQFPIFKLLPKPDKFVFLECSGYRFLYPDAEDGFWGFGEFRVLKYKYEFKRSILGVGLLELPYVPPCYIGFPDPICFGVGPIDFSIKLPSDFYFKIKTDAFSCFFLRGASCRVLLVGIPFIGFFNYHGTNSIFWFLRSSLGKNFRYKQKNEIIEISPEMSLYIGSLYIGGQLPPYICTIGLLGINISIEEKRAK